MSVIGDDYAELFLRAPFGYLTTAPDGVVSRVNDTLLAWLGRDRDDVVGIRFSSMLDAGTRLFWETRHQPVLLMRGEVREVALTLLGADGQKVSVLANSSALAGANGEPTSVMIALLGTRERHEYERTLLEATRSAESARARLQALQSSGAALIGTTSEAAAIESVVSSASAAFGASTVTVFLVDDAGELHTAGGIERAPSTDGPVQLAFDTRGPVTVDDVAAAEQRFPRFVPAMRSGRVEAFSAVPIIADGPALGVLLCTFSRARAIDAATVDLQQALALQAAQAIQRQRLQQRLERLALHDPLTGLANRQSLHDRLELAMSRAADSGRPLGVLFFDLDGFKQVNDTEGHAAGDRVLVEVAVRLTAVVRAEDFCARFGGDEFVVLCGDADAEATRVVAERVRAAVARPFPSTAVGLTASIGIAVIEAGARADVDEVLTRADEAMYLSKQAGRDRVTIGALQ